MIKYRDQTFEDYSICPATGDIFDVKTGEIQPVKLYGGRPSFNSMPVHQIMAHTFLGGYKPGFDVHHLDENKLNNALSNLVYLTRKEHARLHRKGKEVSEEIKAKLSAARKGKPRSTETKAKISAAMKGKHRSEETKAKMSAAHKGKQRGPLSEEHKAKISTANKGKPKSEETKAKMSAAHKGKHRSK